MSRENAKRVRRTEAAPLGATTSNVDLHNQFYAALNAWDESALLALCDPDIKIISVFAAVGGAVYHGHAGVLKWRRELAESWGAEYRVIPDASYDFGERTLALAVLHGRGGQSGIPVAMPAAGIAEWRDGLCTSHTAYARCEDALAELGVSWEALERIAPVPRRYWQR